MKLPDSVLWAIDRLEQAGFETCCVGGCVRDHLLGLEAHDFDLCTAADPAQMKQLFSDCNLVLAGEKHGTVGVITAQGVLEITTFRTDGSYADSRHPEQVTFVHSLREDLARRDFTVNAMAWSPKRGLQDPFGGQEDLEKRCLRCVGDPEIRFREDALRILRGIRFSVAYGLQVEDKTLQAMFACREGLDHLSAERIYCELSRFLPAADARALKTFAPILSEVIPELAPMVGFDQHSPHHRYDVYTHTALVTEQVPAALSARWAALLHDVGKVPTFRADETGRGHFSGHAQVGAQMAEEILTRLKAPKAVREGVVCLISHHMTPLTPDRSALCRYVRRFGMETVRNLVWLQRADMNSKGYPADNSRFLQVLSLLAEIEAGQDCLSLKQLAVNGRDLMQMGFQGPAIGICLENLLESVMENRCENSREALLTAAVQYPRQLGKS